MNVNVGMSCVQQFFQCFQRVILFEFVLNKPDILVDTVLYNGYPGSPSSALLENPFPGRTDPDWNDVSLVILLDSGDVEYLFTGDIGSGVVRSKIGAG